ncbi:MAG: hypothetical protein OXT09_10965 [Myxococcales bacterium]|nr:hypothetical protein [Myxococcales bacterium]
MKLRPLSLLCALTLCACDGKTSDGGGAASAPKPTPPAGAAADGEPAVGTVRGTVRLADGASLPGYSPEQMEKRVLDHAKRGPWPEACTPPKLIDRQPVRAREGGALGGLVIAASQFKQQPKRPQRVHELVIEDCRLRPRTVAAMVGDVLRVKNGVSYPFMPSYGNEPQLRTLTPGQTYDVKLDKPGVTPVLCGFTAPCGRTDVVVMMHPLATTTGDDGSFVIENFPADQKVKLSAWHPLFKEASLELQIGRGEDKTVELVIEPAVAAVPAEADGAEPAPGGEAKPADKAQEPTPAQEAEAKAAKPAAPAGAEPVK